MSEDKLSPTQLSALVSYNPETGLFVWLERGPDIIPDDRVRASWNSKHTGKPALSTNSDQGYLYGSIFDKNVRAHRAAWAIMTGEWPKEDIDHINGIRHDNRIANLRDVARVYNCRNQRRKNSNTSIRKLEAPFRWGEHLLPQGTK